MGLSRRLHELDERVSARWSGRDRTLHGMPDQPEELITSWRALSRAERERYQRAAIDGDITVVPAKYQMPLLEAEEHRSLGAMRVVGLVLLALFAPTLVFMVMGRPGVAAAFSLPGHALGVGLALGAHARHRHLLRRRREAQLWQRSDSVDERT